MDFAIPFHRGKNPIMLKQLVTGSDDPLKNKLQYGLSAPDGFKVQFGPKGSYRSNSNIAFYDWVVPEKTSDEDQTLYITDWFAPNVGNDELDDIFFDRGHGHLNLPGCVTGFLQVPDTHLHFKLSRRYKRREVIDAMHQLHMGTALPTSSTQAVIDRAAASFLDIDHNVVSDGFIENGIAADLFGGDDSRLTKDMKPIFVHCKLAQLREEIGKDIKARVESGELTNWQDFRKPGFLEVYPNDPNMEGTEAFEWDLPLVGPVASEIEDTGDDDSASECVTNPDEDVPDDTDEPLGDLDAMTKFLAETAAEFGEAPPGIAAQFAEELPETVMEFGCEDVVPSPAQPLELTAPAPSSPPLPPPLPPPEEAASPNQCVDFPSAGGSSHVAAACPPTEATGGDTGHAQNLEKVKNSMFGEASAQLLAATRAGLQAVRASGGDKVAEELLLQRIEQLERKKSASVNPGANASQTTYEDTHMDQRLGGRASTRKSLRFAFVRGCVRPL